MTAEIIRRKDARAIGRVRYFTGKPCKHGHIAQRLISNGICLECVRAKSLKWRTENPEKQSAASRRWQAMNPDRVMVIHKKWRDANPEKCRSKAKKWRAENTARAALREKRWCAENPEKVRATKERWHAANPGKFRLYKNRRRARKRAAGGSHTVEQIADLFKKQNGKCVGCICSIRLGYHVDHITALSKGGSNDISNIQLLCALCNKRKNNKDPIVWAQENGRLI